MRKIYIASPLGFSEACRGFYYGRLLPLVRESGFEVLDPWDTEIEIPTPEAEKQKYGIASTCWSESENREAIESSDDMLAILDGTDVDSGTASEIGYAFRPRKKDSRLQGGFPSHGR